MRIGLATIAMLFPSAVYAAGPEGLKKPAGIFFIRSHDIWLAGIDGSAQKQITHVPEPHGSSLRMEVLDYFWLPKARKLVYCWRASYHPRPTTYATAVSVEIVNPQDGKVETIYKRKRSEPWNPNGDNVDDATPQNLYFYPSASRDGETVVYGGNVLYLQRPVVYDLKAKTVKKLDGDPDSLSPDGKYTLHGDTDLYLISASGKSLKRLTDYRSDKNSNSESFQVKPIGWSSDGARALYYRANYPLYSEDPPPREPRDVQHINAIDIHTRKIVAITPSQVGGRDLFEGQSSDGRIVCYTHIDNSIHMVPSTRAVDTVTAKNWEVTPLWWAHGPAISPSGDSIIYEHSGKRGGMADSKTQPENPYDIWKMNIDGSAKTKIVVEGSRPKWEM